MKENELQILMKKIDKKALPKKWNEFVNKITLKHNVIYKNGKECTCTNCNKTFNTGKFKIGDIALCPHCNNGYSVMGSYLYYRGLSFEKSVVIFQRINKQIVGRVFEIYTYFDRKISQMVTSVQEYARVLFGIGTFLNDAVYFYMGHQYVYHHVENFSWHKYSGVRNYLWYEAYPYNKKKLIKGTIMEYAPIEEFLSENCSYSYPEALYLASYPSFEKMWKMGLKNLSECSYMFKKTGSFQKEFGVTKNFLSFMVENDVDYRELQVLKFIKEPNIEALKAFKDLNLNRIRDWGKFLSLTKHIETASELLKVPQDSLDTVLKFVKLNDLIKYKQIPNNFYIYKDYLSFIQKLGFDMTQKKYLFPKNLIEAHDKFEKELSIKENCELIKKVYKRFLDLSIFIYEQNNFIIYPAPNFHAFSEESRMQQNCVRQYVKSYANGDTEIYFMRNKDNIQESLVTVEYKNGKIIQKEQKQHTQPSNEQNEFLIKWLKFRNRKKNIVFNEVESSILVA